MEDPLRIAIAATRRCRSHQHRGRQGRVLAGAGEREVQKGVRASARIERCKQMVYRYKCKWVATCHLLMSMEPPTALTRLEGPVFQPLIFCPNRWFPPLDRPCVLGMPFQTELPPMTFSQTLHASTCKIHEGQNCLWRVEHCLALWRRAQAEGKRFVRESPRSAGVPCRIPLSVAV